MRTFRENTDRKTPNDSGEKNPAFHSSLLLLLFINTFDENWIKKLKTEPKTAEMIHL